MIPVIISGGIGTKLWPISREHKPKYFQKLIGEKSIFELDYEALLTKFKPEEIYISANEDRLKMAKIQAPDIPDANYIVEPERRNQGPATALIAAFLYMHGHEDEPFIIIQGDDLREPTDQFIKLIDVCEKLALKETRYITGGFRPKETIMGIDYLVRGEKIMSENELNVFEVNKFIKRSTREEIDKLIIADDVLAHSNHSCMTPRNFMNMLKKYKLDWYEPLQNIINGADINTEYAKMPVGPIEDVTKFLYDNGEALVVELPFTWTDFGTFESLFKYLKNKNLYKTDENIVDLNGKNNFVKLDDSNKVVALIGVDNLIVVDTGDALLISKDTATNDIKDAVAEIKKRNLQLT